MSGVRDPGAQPDPGSTPPAPARGGDPLAAMYVLAAALLFVGSIVVIGMLFVPSNWFSGGDAASEQFYVPGAGTTYASINRPAASFEAPGVREVEPRQYIAVIEAYNWEFEPKVIRIPVGSRVTFRARSSQDYHGIAIIGTNIILSLARNNISEATHVFEEPGEYMFVCSDYCGAGHALMTGTIYVE